MIWLRITFYGVLRARVLGLLSVHQPSRMRMLQLHTYGIRWLLGVDYRSCA